MKQPRFLLLIVVLALVMVACGGEETPTPTLAPTAEPVEEPTESPTEAPAEEPTPIQEPAPTEEPAPEEESATPADPLAGTTWTLTELIGESLLPTTEITAQFNEDGTVSGSSGCNNYNATYEVEGNNITINSSPAAMTLMACPEPIMEQESAYLEALSAAETFEASEDELVLYDASGNPVAVFSAVSQDLAGTSWDVISYNNGRGGVTSLIIGTEITANFGDDGEMTGNAGCNDYFGAYETDGENISMGPFGTTRKACREPEGIMQQEAEYLAALETAATYSVDGMTMNMRTAEGSTVANFRKKLPIADLIITPGDISLSTGSLEATWQAFVVPHTPYDQSQPPGPVGMPTHIEILFGDGADPAAHELGQPIMYIIPANTYRKMWNEAGNDAVTRTMQEIQDLNFVLTSPAPTSGYPALPFEEIGAGTNDLAVQMGRAVSQAELNTVSATQDGYRFIGRWIQDPNPVTNQGLRYVYQGFTNDGLYVVSFWWPKATPVLPNDVSEVPVEEMEAFNGDYAAYMEATAAALNATSSEEWDPDIALLDAVVASLEISGMTPSGLVDKTWQWTQGPAQPGSSELIEVPDPSLYEVTYGSDGNITYTADCNSGSMPYEISNAGMTGSMLAQPGPMTLAECGPDSLSDSFIASLQAAQSYRVWAGGNEMELVLPAGGGFLLFRDADAPEKSEAGGAAVSGMVTNADNAVIPEGATASIQIQDTSLADAPATVIGEQIIENPGQFPIAYQVAYDPGEIVDNHTYTMRTRIEAADGTLLFINDTAIPVITRGNPTEDVEIPVIQVASSGGDEACVTGTITYPQRIALPEEAVVQVQIQDTSLADAPAEVIGEQIIESPGQVPIPYEVCYDPNLIQDNHTYTMSARISDGEGNLMWINDTAIPVIINGNPTEDVVIPVVQVGG
jgi:uncharacterized lipoprotein YbaY/heat shock protein HslJ